MSAHASRLTLSSLFLHLGFRLDGAARQMSAHASMADTFLAIVPYLERNLNFPGGTFWADFLNEHAAIQPCKPDE